MKIQHYILVLVTAITCTMCNKTQKENAVSSVKKNKTETENCSQPMSKDDSLKMINHQIEVKGNVKFPLQLTVDSLQKMKVTTITNFKVVCQTGLVKKDNKTCKGVLLKDILKKSSNQTKWAQRQKFLYCCPSFRQLQSNFFLGGTI